MSTRELSSQDITESTLPLDTDPQVSFDITFKEQLKPGTVIDVNYAALRENIQQLDGPADNSDLSITIRPKGALGKDIGGMYSPDDKHIDIMVSAPKRTQKNLQHETRHYTDILKNPITEAEDTRNKIGQVATVLMRPLSYTNISMFASNILLSNGYISEALTNDAISPQDYNTVHNYIEIAQATSSVATLGAVAVFGTMYLAHGRERTARKAERKSLPTVITLNTPKKA